jgi:hypothetical protein
LFESHELVQIIRNQTQEHRYKIKKLLNGKLRLTLMTYSPNMCELEQVTLEFLNIDSNVDQNVRLHKIRDLKYWAKLGRLSTTEYENLDQMEDITDDWPYSKKCIRT